MPSRSRKGVSALILLLSTAMISAASAGPFEDGVSAAKRGDYATALMLWRPLAEAGDSAAQFNIGIAYLNGYGVSKDAIEAERWFRLAAEKGSAPAQNALGNLFIPRGPDLKDGRAAEAAGWYLKAAEQGHIRAQQSLGLLYEGGVGVPKDFVQALMWYIIASTNAPDDKSRDFAVQNYNALTHQMSSEQVARAQQLAKDWRPKAQPR